MICKNCGFQNPDGAKFCASCGQKIEMSNPIPQNNVSDSNTQQNNIPQNNAQQNSVTQNNNQHNSVHQNNVSQGNFVHQGNVKQNNVLQNKIPNNYNPQGNVPQGNIPNNYNPQNTMPNNNIPQGNVPNNIPNNYNPQNNIPQGNFQPQNGMPQFNNFPNQGVNQTVIDPVTGQPVKNKSSKKVLPLILGIVGCVVAIIVAVVIVFSVIDNSGINGVLDSLEDGINDKNVEAIKKCVPEFMVKDMDISQSDIDDMFGVSDKYSFEIDFDVTNSNCSEANNYTWKEYIQDRYEDYDGYDGGEVEEVTKAKVKYDIDFDNDTANAIAGLASLGENDLTKDVYFVKYDGSWYLFEM